MEYEDMTTYDRWHSRRGRSWYATHLHGAIVLQIGESMRMTLVQELFILDF